MKALNITPIAFTNSKYQKFQFYKVTQYLHKKTTLKIMLEQLVFYLHHDVHCFKIKLNFIIYWEMTLNNVYPTFIDLQKNKNKNCILHECKELRNANRLLRV
jgi:hypothetical protein